MSYYSEERLSDPINPLWKSTELYSTVGGAGTGADRAHHSLGHDDFLGLVTAIAELYSQDDVLEMQTRKTRGEPLAKGSMSEVSTVNAAFTSPSPAVSYQVTVQTHVVVVKQSASSIFPRDKSQHGWNNNQGNQSLRSFISELRILSHRGLRKDPNVIELLGIQWDYLETGFPEPLMILEKGDMDLHDYTKRNWSLPFATKKKIALDIARGIAALHRCNIIHGDIKPDNILLFNTQGPNPLAKVSDFSHSFPDTGETRRVVGGTALYRAPEWERTAQTSQLRQTDVYSYGLVFADLILSSPFHGGRSLQFVQALKDENEIRGYLYSAIFYKDMTNTELHLDDLPMVRAILHCTLDLDPSNRDLAKVQELLDPSFRRERHDVKKPDWVSTSNLLTIPYHALQNVSPTIMDHIIDALRTVAESPTDNRRAAASMELAICEASGFGTPPTFEGYSHSRLDDLDPSWAGHSTLRHILEAGHKGNPWARTIVHRMSLALKAGIPDD